MTSVSCVKAFVGNEKALQDLAEKDDKESRQRFEKPEWTFMFRNCQAIHGRTMSRGSKRPVNNKTKRMNALLHFSFMYFIVGNNSFLQEWFV